jgi:hypothetical protein
MYIIILYIYRWRAKVLLRIFLDRLATTCIFHLATPRLLWGLFVNHNLKI